MSLESRDQRISYYIALNMGRRMKAEGVPLDADAFAEGIRDAISGAEAKMTDEEINVEMMAMQEKMQAARRKCRRPRCKPEAGQAYLAENASADGVQVTAAVFSIEWLRRAPVPSQSADSVEVHYEAA